MKLLRVLDIPSVNDHFSSNCMQEQIYLYLHSPEGDYKQMAGGTIERCGSGVHTSVDGSVYNCKWINDQMTESGSIRFASGATYEGGLLENCFNGMGRYTWPNGSYLQAVFNKNK